MASNKVSNIGDMRKIKAKYLPILKETEDFYKRELAENLQSLYIRGSVSVGKDTKFSDMDFVAVTGKKISKAKEASLFAFSKKLQARFRFVNGFDLATITLQELINSKEYFNLRLNLKTSSVLLFGKDVRPRLPGVIPNKKLSLKMFQYAHKEYRKADKYFSSTNKRSYLGKVRPEEFWCGWIMRVLSRSGMGILMLEEKKYTNDIIYITRKMARKYPEFKGFFEQIAQWVIKPTSDRKKIKLFLDKNVKSYFKFWKKLLV